jgi:Uncharacterised protein family (UPF0014)
MTGQILGGAPLVEAVKSQILVMFRQMSESVTSAIAVIPMTSTEHPRKPFLDCGLTPSTACPASPLPPVARRRLDP